MQYLVILKQGDSRARVGRRLINKTRMQSRDRSHYCKLGLDRSTLLGEQTSYFMISEIEGDRGKQNIQVFTYINGFLIGVPLRFLEARLLSDHKGPPINGSLWPVYQLDQAAP